ncbi:hypothetical protein CVS40_12912 [Lucilia cuprina]|nr:hypothetical protein CVS40_12912 [Lucilia cuprina]
MKREACRFVGNVNGGNTPEGVDNITYDTIRALPDFAKCSLLTALNDAFLESNVSKEWSTIKIVPIPKNDKDLSNYENFCPITLISVLLKIVNMMIKERINKFINDNSIIPVGSFAHRKGRSSSMCLNDFLHNVAKLKHKGSKVIILVLDISNAYNCFLSKRTLILGNNSNTVDDRLPQESCLSPMFFNLYTGKLHEFQDDNILLYQFADLQSHNLIEILNKTRAMYLAKRSIKKIQIRIDNSEIEQVKNVKLLGININASLTVGDRVLSESKSGIGLWSKLTTIKSALLPKSFIRSKIEYTRTTASINRKITFQNKIFRRCLGLEGSDQVNTGYKYERNNGFTVYTDLLPDRKEKTPIGQSRALANYKLHEYANNGFGIYATDASIGDTATGCGVFIVGSGSKINFKIDHPTSSLFGE